MSNLELVAAAQSSIDAHALFTAALRLRAIDLELSAAVAARDDRILNETVLHSSIGQELAPAALGLLKAHGDLATSTHRGLAHSLGWGVDPRAVIAECAGRPSGTAYGRGGHMHILSPADGFLGTNGIVGGGLTISVGAAEAIRMSGADNVVVAYAGDGAINTGAFGESLNLAGVWGVPLLLVVENNGWSEYTSSSSQRSSRSVVDRAVGYGVDAISVDSADPAGLAASLVDAMTAVRSGSGPMLVEVLAPRIGGHWVGDAQKYRDPADHDAAVGSDPLVTLASLVGMDAEAYDAALAERRAWVADLIADVLAEPATDQLEPDGWEA